MGLMDLLRRKEVSAADLRDCAVRAIEKLNPRLNFMVEPVKPVPVAATAGAFQDLPFLLKDCQGCSGQSLAQGSRLLNGLKAPSDSEYVRRLKAAGVAILGATTMPEFGIYPVTESLLHGATRNPWNLDHSPGGSSGGSSAAVAAGVVPVAGSSDGGGSIRGPAHCCGVFGLKPSRGRTASGLRGDAGLFPFAQFHVTSRSVRDSAAFLDVLQGHEAGSRYFVTPPARPFLAEIGENPGRLRIAFTRVSPSPTPLHPDCRDAVDRAARLCESLGHQVEEASPAVDWMTLMEAFTPTWIAILPFALDLFEKMGGRKAGPDTLEPMTLKLHERAKALTIADLLRADAGFQAARRTVDLFFRQYDAWITPGGVTPAPRIGELGPSAASGESVEEYGLRALGGYAAFTPLLNITGHPAASVPLHQAANGLPAGVQIVTALGDEATLLRLAAQWEAADPWRGRVAPVSVLREQV
jgi:amidase